MVPKGVINAYVRRIRDYGEITIEDVPPQARKEVEEELEDKRPNDQSDNKPDNKG